MIRYYGYCRKGNKILLDMVCHNANCWYYSNCIRYNVLKMLLGML